MGEIIVRNLDGSIIAALKAKAELHGCSLEEEVRGILTDAAKPSMEERQMLVDRIRGMTTIKRQTDSTTLLRKFRDQ
jgi:antitoxin FitA